MDKVAGISSLGITLSYGVETEAGTKPSAFTKLNRINNIAGVSVSTEQIDASALEDFLTHYVAGRGDIGGEWAITVNATNDTVAEWQALQEASDTAFKSGKMTWFQVASPYLTEAFFVKAQLPSALPMPEIGQNELLTMEISLTLNEYVGMATKVSVA